jgi:hypothetical protein
MEKEEVLIYIIKERLAVARSTAIALVAGILAVTIILVLSDLQREQIILSFIILIMMGYGVFVSIKNHKKYFNHLIDIYNTKE